MGQLNIKLKNMSQEENANQGTKDQSQKLVGAIHLCLEHSTGLKYVELDESEQTATDQKGVQVYSMDTIADAMAISQMLSAALNIEH